jgi:hypothetical protein
MTPIRKQDTSAQPATAKRRSRAAVVVNNGARFMDMQRFHQHSENKDSVTQNNGACLEGAMQPHHTTTNAPESLRLSKFVSTANLVEESGLAGSGGRSSRDFIASIQDEYENRQNMKKQAALVAPPSLDSL